MKTPKSHLTAEQPLTKKTRTYQKDLLLPKTKKKPQGDSRRGAFTIQKSKLIKEVAYVYYPAKKNFCTHQCIDVEFY